MNAGKTAWVLGVAVVAVAGVFLYYTKTQAAPIPQPAPIQVTWLIAHEPVSLFDNAAVVFANEFNKDSDGKIVIKILGPSDFGSTNGHLTNQQVFDALNNGKVQLATEVTSALAASDTKLDVLSLPFVFKSVPDAESVLDGPIGNELLRSIDASTSATGLAFTFSGGLMVIESDKKAITSAADFKGLTIGTINGKVSEATLSDLGATPVVLESSAGSKAANDQLSSLGGIETPYTRIATTTNGGEVPKYVSETDHSFFLTAILASDSFYGSLSAQDQAALQKAAQAAAAQERSDSLALAQQKRAQLEAEGTIVTTLTPSEEQDLQQASASVYQEFAAKIGDLAQQIEAAQP